MYVAAEDELAVVGVYVDDIVVACKSEKRMKFKKAICERFDVKDLGKVHHFLGMKVVQDDESGDVWIGQPTYVEKVLEKYDMLNAKAVSTPVDVSAKLVQAGEDDELLDQGLYQSAVGSL